MNGPRTAALRDPLRSRTLLWQLAVVVLAEVVLYRSYAAHVAEFHWATHFLVGVTVAALWCAGVVLATGRAVRLQLLPVLGFHLWAMWPDLAFRFGLPHYRWMDWAALGHISSHYLPGGVASWLVVALAAWVAYALVLGRELGRARRSDARHIPSASTSRRTS